MEYITLFSTIASAILSLAALITLGTKGGRKLIVNLFKKNTRDIKELNSQQSQNIEDIMVSLQILSSQVESITECSRQQCRNDIKNIYYRYCHEKKIPIFERKTADSIYQIYHNEFHGNSYATLLYEEITKWEIDHQFSEDGRVIDLD